MLNRHYYDSITMIQINTFKTIFNTNNWFFCEQENTFLYGDQNTTINKVYLSVPFKEDVDYNKKLTNYLKNFLLILSNKVPNQKNTNITHVMNFTSLEKSSVTITIQNISFYNNTIKIYWIKL